MQPLKWRSAGRGPQDSVPIGNGHVGANVWLERDGRIGVYLGTNDSWSENGRLLKIARLWIDAGKPIDCDDSSVRINFELDVATATVTVTCGGPGGLSARVWVDANRDTLWADVESATPARLTIDPWRVSPRRITNSDEGHSFIGQRLEPEPLTVEPDELRKLPPGIAVVHANRGSVVDSTLAQQGLEQFADLAADPIRGRVSGVLAHVVGADSSADAPAAAGSQPALSITGGKRTLFACEVVSAQLSETDWEQAVQGLARESGAGPDRKAHEQWWSEFHQRSGIEITAGANAREVTQAYALHRYMIGCSARGPHPVKFNGALFNVDATVNGQSLDADYRRWGGGYWFQNTRLIYWPLLAGGDWEMVEPLAQMFLGALPLAEARTRHYFNHGGAFFPETMTFWGSYLFSNYGYDRDGLPVGEITNEFIKRYWCGALELVQMLLDWASYWTSDRKRILQTYAEPLALATLRFYVEHHEQQDDDGKLRLEPAQVLETWWDSSNPAPDIAGLMAVTETIGRCGPHEISTELRELAAAVARVIPPLPFGRDELSAHRYVLPAHEYDNRNNLENCALYTVFPFPIYGVGREDLEVGRTTWQHRPFRMSHGWSQDGIQAALLGLADEAQRIVSAHALQRNSDYRFPAFWGPNFDWVPDMDHGGSMMTALQRMALQSHPDSLHVTPAWPADWNGWFLLHGHDGVRVEADIEAGEVSYLSVLAQDGRKEPDVTVHAPQQPDPDHS